MNGNAFSLSFSGPFTGYQREIESLATTLHNGAQLSLIRGSRGAGKTAFLKELRRRLPHASYLPKLPAPTEWQAAFDSLLPQRFRLFRRPRTVAELALRLPRLRSRVTLLIDECDSATAADIAALRTFMDAAPQFAAVLAAGSEWQPPAGIAERIECTIALAGLDPPSFREFLKQRIVACGGRDIEPLTSETIAAIHQRCNGLPLQGLKLCNELWQQAQRKGLSTIDLHFLEPEPTPMRPIELSSLQRQILDTLAVVGPLTPAELANSLDSGYKDRANAIRAVNNLLSRLHHFGFVSRERAGRCYRYATVAGRAVPAMLK